jgi:Polyketide cyclase / dehydrase and lipid transport
MHVHTRAQLEIAASPEVVFDLAADYRNLSRFVRPSLGIPGVERAEMVGGGPAKAGMLRRLEMSDGSAVEEELLALDRPRLHSYRWTRPPAPPLSLLVRGAQASWVFEPAPSGRGTTLTWSYAFELSSPLAYPAGLLLRGLFSRWMRATLARVRDAAVSGEPVG